MSSLRHRITRTDLLLRKGLVKRVAHTDIYCLSFFAAECRDSLGMQSGEIPDDAITASSSYDAASVGPQNGR